MDDSEDYWSDFSDDIYTQEAAEEKKANEILLSLQRWIYSSNLESYLREKHSTSRIITLDQFKRALSTCGYYCEILDLQTLLKRLDIKDSQGIDYVKFLTDLNEKNAAWWKETIKNSSFELSYRGKKNGNIRPLCSRPVYTFIENNLNDIAEQAINKAGYLTIDEFVDELFKAKTSITKRELRKGLLDNEIPLARLDTHILYKEVTENRERFYKNDFLRYLGDDERLETSSSTGDNVTVLKRGGLEGAIENVMIDEEVVDGGEFIDHKDPSPKKPQPAPLKPEPDTKKPDPTPIAKKDAPKSVPTKPQAKDKNYDLYLNKLENYVKRNAIDVGKTLREVDENHDEIIDLDTFKKWNDTIESPLSGIELKSLHKKMKTEFGAEPTINDIMTKLQLIDEPGAPPKKDDDPFKDVEDELKKKQKQEEDAKKKANDEEAKKKKQDEDAKKQAKNEQDRKNQKGMLDKLIKNKDAKKLKEAEEEAARLQKAKEEAEKLKKQQDELRRKQKEEADLKKAKDEADKKKAKDESAKKNQKSMLDKLFKNKDTMKKKEQEEAQRKKQQEEAKKAKELEDAKKAKEIEDALKRKELEKKLKKEQEEKKKQDDKLKLLQKSKNKLDDNVIKKRQQEAKRIADEEAKRKKEQDDKKKPIDFYPKKNKDIRDSLDDDDLLDVVDKNKKKNIYDYSDEEDDMDRYSPNKIHDDYVPSPSPPRKRDDSPDYNEKVVKLKLLEDNLKDKNILISSLQDEIRILRESTGGNNSKSQNEISILEKENRTLNKKLQENDEKYREDRRKMEEVIRESMITPESGDFMLLQKKIEILERSLYEREKKTQHLEFSGSAKDKKEIRDLRQQIEEQNSYYQQVINKKNQEISIFRDELDLMLTELDQLKKVNLEKEQLFMQKKGDLIDRY